MTKVVFLWTKSALVDWYSTRVLKAVHLGEVPAAVGFLLINNPRNEYGELCTVEELGSYGVGVATHRYDDRFYYSDTYP